MRSEARFSRNAETEIDTLSLHDALPIYFTRRQVAIQNRVASNIGISQSTFSVKDIAGDPVLYEIGSAVQQECRDRDRHSFPTRRSSDLFHAAASCHTKQGRQQYRYKSKHL